MVRALLRWSIRIGILAVVAVAVSRLLANRSDDAGGGGIVPPITGDTWPPVPLNPDPWD